MNQPNFIAGRHEEERESAEALVGCILDERYRLDAVAGEGGFAVVFRAIDLRMETEVAVKLARPGSSDVGLRFKNEVALSARLSGDRGIARATDRGTLNAAGPFDGCPFLVTSFVRGRELESRLSYHLGTFPFDGVIRIARDVLRALEHLHERGIVHRDIKPKNIMVRDDGSSVLIDLGVAFATGEGNEPRSPDLTRARQIVGTKLYMSPEQGLGQRPQRSFDVYALGVTLYQLVTGEPPFRAIHDQLLIKHKLNEKIPPVTRLRRDTPPVLADAIDSMLAKEPKDRPTAAEVLEQLRDLRSGPIPVFPQMLSASPSAEPSPTTEPAPEDDAAPQAAILPLDPVSSPRRRGEPSPIESSEEKLPQDTAPAVAQRPGFSVRTALVLLSALVLLAAVGWALSRPQETPRALRPMRLKAIPDEALERPSAPPLEEPTAEQPEAAVPLITSPESPTTESPPSQPPVEAPTPKKPKNNPGIKRKQSNPSNLAPPQTEDPPRKNAEQCAEARSSATQKLGMNKMKDVLNATRDASCWKSNLAQRTYLRVTAFHSLGNYKACQREASGSTDARVVSFRQKCKEEAEKP